MATAFSEYGDQTMQRDSECVKSWCDTYQLFSQYSRVRYQGNIQNHTLLSLKRDNTQNQRDKCGQSSY